MIFRDQFVFESSSNRRLIGNTVYTRENVRSSPSFVDAKFYFLINSNIFYQDFEFFPTIKTFFHSFYEEIFKKTNKHV